MILAVFTLLFATDSLMAKGKKVKSVSSVITIDGKKKKALIMFTDIDGNDASVKGNKLDAKTLQAAQEAAESGKPADIKYKPGKKGPAIVEINGVVATKKVKKNKK